MIIENSEVGIQGARVNLTFKNPVFIKFWLVIFPRPSFAFLWFLPGAHQIFRGYREKKIGIIDVVLFYFTEMRTNPLNRRREYYVHYENLDRRLDEWIDGKYRGLGFLDLFWN